MDVFFKLNNFDFPLYLFLLSPNLFPLLLCHCDLMLHVGLPVMLVFFPMNVFLTLSMSVMPLLVQVMSLLGNLFARIEVCV